MTTKTATMTPDILPRSTQAPAEGSSPAIKDYFSFIKDENEQKWNNYCFSSINADYKPTDGGHRIDHLVRVLRNCFRLAQEQTDADNIILIIGSYFHDFCSFPKNSYLSHTSSIFTANHVLSMIDRQDLSNDQVEKLYEVIECHSYSAALKGSSIESDILYDADKLDALGAIGVARLFCISGALDTHLYDLCDPFAEQRKLDGKHFALDHFFEKILGIPEKMRTPLGRKIAKEKVRFVSDFLSQIKVEIL